MMIHSQMDNHKRIIGGRSVSWECSHCSKSILICGSAYFLILENLEIWLVDDHMSTFTRQINKPASPDDEFWFLSLCINFSTVCSKMAHF